MWLGEELHWYLCLPKTQWRKQVWFLSSPLSNPDQFWDSSGINQHGQGLRSRQQNSSSVMLTVHLLALWFPFSSQAVIFMWPPHSPSLIPVGPFVVLGTICCGEKQWVCRQMIEWEHDETFFSGISLFLGHLRWKRRGVFLLSLSKGLACGTEGTE